MPPRVTNVMNLAQGELLRATRLDNCGRVVYGDRASAVSDGFVSVGATAQTSTVDAIDVQNAKGKSVIFRGAKTKLTGYALELVFAEVDPELFTLITGQRVIFDADGAAVGFAVSTSVDLGTRAFALEVWSNAGGGDACDDEDAEGSYGYFLYPFNQGGILGDHTIENGGITFTITGVTTADGNHWGVGPYDVVLNEAVDPEDPKVPGPLLVPLEPNDHELVQATSVAPPEITHGAYPLLDPAWPNITTITATVVEDEFVATIVSTPDAEHGVWWDFGDGTWDFVAGNGDTTHDYTAAGAGTYTLRGSANGTWVTTPVVVPGV